MSLEAVGETELPRVFRRLRSLRGWRHDATGQGRYPATLRQKESTRHSVRCLLSRASPTDSATRRSRGVAASYSFIAQAHSNGVAEPRAGFDALVSLYNEQVPPEKNGSPSPAARRESWYVRRVGARKIPAERSSPLDVRPRRAV